MQGTVKMLENGNIGQIDRVYGRILFTLIIYFAFGSYSNAQEIALNCYDTTRGESGYYLVKTKFVNLETKRVINEISIAEEGELVNLIPTVINRRNDTLLFSAVNTKCYCKNTSAGDYNTYLTLINRSTHNLLFSRNVPHQILTDISLEYPDNIKINGSIIDGNIDIPVDGIYRLGRNMELEKTRNINIYDHPNTIRSLDLQGLARLIAPNLYFDIYDGHYYIIKTDNQSNIIDTLRLDEYENRNTILAAKDTILYVFSINYEVHIKGRIDKGYRQDWITPNVRIFNIMNFRLADSLSIPDYPEGDFISSSYGVAKIDEPFITYYFGDSGDMDLLYPAMLFIFDTRTNEATWLRVGWR
jgi:hypothetical protein